MGMDQVTIAGGIGTMWMTFLEYGGRFAWVYEVYVCSRVERASSAVIETS